jgi:2-haloacid dehalogenase
MRSNWISTRTNAPDSWSAYTTLAAFPDVKPGLQQLKAMGLRLAVLSNGEPKMLESAVPQRRHCRIVGRGDQRGRSQSVQAKPARVRAGATHLNAPKTSIGFVTSNNWDAHGAGSAGLTTFWIQRAATEPAEELGYPPAHVVHLLTDLPALVRRT